MSRRTGTGATRRKAKVSLGVAALAVLCIAGPALTAPDAGAISPSYASGTMFVADQTCACVWEIPPNGSPGIFAGANESPQDVVTDAAGDVFWTEAQSQTVQELPAGGSEKTLVSGIEAWGVAVDASGDVYFGSFTGPDGAGLYELPSGGTTPNLVTSSYGVFTSLAVDGNGDIWGGDSAANLVYIPHGSSTGIEVAVPGYGYINGVRFDGADNLYLSTGFGDAALELPAGSGIPTAFGSGLGYTEGVAVDASGDVFVGTPSGVSGFGKVYEFPSSGSQRLYASGEMADTGGLAIWPPPSPRSRTATTTTLTTTSPATVNTERVVSLKATVGAGISGYVQFDVNGQSLGGLVAVSGGSAVLHTTLPKGTDAITAGYLGNRTKAPSVSNSLSFTATPIPTITTISAPDGTNVPGDGEATVDVTVTGHGGTPTGDVEFFVRNSYVTSATLSGGQGTASFPLPVGRSTVKATYEGDPTFNNSNSKGIAFQTVPPYNPTVSTSVKYGTRNSLHQRMATIHVTVIGFNGPGVPTGTVTANDGFTCTALTPNATGPKSSATCSDLLNYNTAETVTITYGGDSNYNAAYGSAYVFNGSGG
jgi:hypothetical protein